MRNVKKSISVILAVTAMTSIAAFASDAKDKEIPTGVVRGSIAGGSGYANASTRFTPGSVKYQSEIARVFIESVHENGTQLASNYAQGSNYDKYNAWTSLRDTRAVTWHSSHGSTGTDRTLWLHIDN